MRDMIYIDAGAAATLIVGFLAAILGWGKVLLWQFERRVKDRDAAAAELRIAQKNLHDEQIEAVERLIALQSDRVLKLSDQVDTVTQILPLEYVRREDDIRRQAVIEAKLDAIAGELKQIQIMGVS